MDRGSYRRVINAFRTLDNSISKNLHRKQISCKKGCIACCELVINISQIEAMVILKYVDNIKLKLDWVRVNEQSGLQSKMNATEYAGMHNGCVFLDDKGGCSIYPVRPIACRSHLVSSASELCGLPDGKVNKYDTYLAVRPMIDIIIQEHKHYGLKSTIESIQNSLIRVHNGQFDRTTDSGIINQANTST
jgi:Fe-S-cluster containining protein